MEYKDKLHLIPTSVVRIILYLSFVLYAWQMTGTVANSLPYLGGQSSLNYKTAFVICQLVTAGINLAVFELIGSFYYSFIRPICPPARLTHTGFMVYLRFAYIVRNVLAGSFKLIFLRSDLELFAYDSLINLSATVLALSLVFVYVISKYVPLRAKPAFIRCACIPFLVYEAITVGLSLL